MNYFKVPANLDGKRFYKNGEWFTLVANELLTPFQCKKHGVNTNILTMVSVRHIYWFFGCRFDMKD